MRMFIKRFFLLFLSLKMRPFNFWSQFSNDRVSHSVRAITHARSLSNNTNGDRTFFSTNFRFHSFQIHLHRSHQPELVRTRLRHLLRGKEIHVAGVGWRVHQVPLAGPLPSKCLQGLRIRKALWRASSHGQKLTGLTSLSHYEVYAVF